MFSWNLSTDELMLDTIWEKFEDFCKPKSNNVRARFDLLTSFQQETSQLMNGTMQYRPRLLWLSTPPETAKVPLQGHLFGFFMKDEEFVSKKIDDNNIDLDRFPTSKVRQLAKKMESSKVTTSTSSRWQVAPRKLRSI